MTPQDYPATMHDYFERCLARLPSQARLALVLDPPGLLELGETVEVRGQHWTVFHYDSNDLAFRKAYGHHGPNAPHLIWVTRPPGCLSAAPPALDLTFLTDVARRADGILDLSLLGALKTLKPRETWPPEAVARFEPLLAAHLGMVLAAHTDLRRILGPGVPLDTHCLRALVLHALHPAIPISDLTFRDPDPRQVLTRYLRLLVQEEWTSVPIQEVGVGLRAHPRSRADLCAHPLALLREQARLAPGPSAEELVPWFDAPPAGLMLYLYLRRLLGRRRVANIAAVTRGLLPFDPRPLEPWVDIGLRLWDDDPAWRKSLIVRAEQVLDEAELEEALALLGAERPADLFAALADAEAPAVVYGLGRRLLASVTSAEELGRIALTWARRRPPLAAVRLSAHGEARPETPYSRRALDLASFLDELAFLFDRLMQEMSPPTGLAGLVDWYVELRLYDLEYAGARADEALRRLPGLTEPLRPLLDRVRATVRKNLDRLDQELARRITSNWRHYLGHPRLSSNLLRDTLITPRQPVRREACVWIVVFDGMRYDSWERVIKPRLLERYSLDWERPYLSLLPSWTGIARTGLLAGKPPEGWRSYRGSVTTNQEMLVARLFGLSEAERKRRLRFYSGMESDRTQRQLDRRKRFPYNILVFNVSDDNLHAVRGDLVTLNTTINSLLDSILEVLEGLVQADDMLVVTSDHGFVELEPDQSVTIRDDTRWQCYVEGGPHPVHYRFTRGVDRPEGLAEEEALTFEYPALRDGQFTVAVGRRWFAREGAARSDRYTHGGLSLAEMVVTGAVLRPIVTPLVRLALEGFPRALAVQEGEEAVVEFTLVNSGNQPAHFTLEVGADTAREPLRQEGDLRPGQRLTVSCRFTPLYADTPGEVGTERIGLKVAYKDAQGKRRRLSRSATVTVEPRKDIVKFSLGSLDDLDDL